MLGLYFEGILLGGVCAFFVGPVLFTLIDASLQDGFRTGARVALGIALSDAVAIALVIAGLGPILTHPTGACMLGLGGGMILMGFGGALAWRANQIAPPSAGRPTSRPFWTGFTVNFVNPFVFSFWVGAVGGVGTRHGWTSTALVPTFCGMLTTILATDLLKAAAASALSRHLTGPILTLARRVSGVLLLVAGLVLFVHSLTPAALEP